MTLIICEGKKAKTLSVNIVFAVFVWRRCISDERWYIAAVCMQPLCTMHTMQPLMSLLHPTPCPTYPAITHGGGDEISTLAKFTIMVSQQQHNNNNNNNNNTTKHTKLRLFENHLNPPQAHWPQLPDAWYRWIVSKAVIGQNPPCFNLDWLL